MAAVLATGASAARAADPTSVVATITAPSSVTTGASTCIGVHLADATTGQPVQARSVAVNIERIGTSLGLGTDMLPQGSTDASGNGSFCWTPQFVGMIQLDASGLVLLGDGDGFVTATSNIVNQTVDPPPLPPGPPVTQGTAADALTLTVAAATPTASVGDADSVTIAAGAPGVIRFNATTLSVAAVPSWITVSSVQTNQGSCSTTTDGTISCAFGVLQAGTQATVTLSVVASSAGQLNVSASASGYPAGGYLPTGNSATTSTTITFAQPPPPVTVTGAAPKATAVGRRCQVPKLVGDTVAQARKAIAKAGCVLARIVHKKVETTARRRRVIAQLPRWRGTLRRGGKITITVGAATA